jgi:hypothetical protein
MASFLRKNLQSFGSYVVVKYRLQGSLTYTYILERPKVISNENQNIYYTIYSE